MFSRYGSVQDVWVAHKPPGFAFVFYKTVREAREAVKGADGRTVCGVRVRVRMGTEVEIRHRGKSLEREFSPPQRERSRRGSSHQSKGYHQSSGRSTGWSYEERSPSPPRSGWSRRGGHHQGISHGHSSTRQGYSSKSSHHIGIARSPSPSHSRYKGGHKRDDGPSSHYLPSDGGSRYGRESNRITRHHHVSPERYSRFSPPSEMEYHGGKRGGSSRFERHHQVEQYDKPSKSRGGGYRDHVYPKPSAHQHHRSRSPHSFSPPPPSRQHDRRQHGSNKATWSHANYSPTPGRHYDDNHDNYHRGYKQRHGEQFESRSFASNRADRGSRRDDGRPEHRYRDSKNSDHSYKSADREVKYREHRRFPGSENYSRRTEYHEPFGRHDVFEYTEDSGSDRGSSLEGVGVDDDFSDVMVECGPNDLRRKLLNETTAAADSQRQSERG